MKKLLLFVLSAVLFASCGDDDSTDTIKYNRPGRGVFICCEGNLGYDNASLSYYDIAGGKVDNQIYKNANGWYLGDNLQSMSIIGGVGYLVVAGSDRVIAFDPVTFRHKGMITSVVKPRYVASEGNNIYISSLGSQYVTIAGRDKFKVSATIDMGKEGEVPNTSEQIVIHGGYLYTNMWSYVRSSDDWLSGDKVFKVDLSTKKVVERMSVASQPNSMVLDKNNKLWVLSGGESDGSVLPELIRVDPATMTAEAAFRFGIADGWPSKLNINKAGDKLYYINSRWGESGASSGVYVMDISASGLPETAVVKGEGISFYGLGIDPANSDIYVSDALDYKQGGVVYHYNSTGSELKATFSVGIVPGSFCFKEASN